MTKRTIRKRTDGPGTSVPLSPVAPTEANPPEPDPPDPAGSHGGRTVRGDASDDDDHQELEGVEGISPVMEGPSINAPSPRARGAEITEFIIRSPAGEAGEEASRPRLDKGKGRAVKAESPTARARGVLQPPAVIQEEVPDEVVAVTRKHRKALREIAEEINELRGEFIAADKRLEDLEENAATLHRNAHEEHTLYVRFRERLEGRASKMRALMDALAEEDEDEPEGCELGTGGTRGTYSIIAKARVYNDSTNRKGHRST
jgi:hypothetical protein